MGVATLTCDVCRNRVPGHLLNTSGMTACPGCGTALRYLIFPAYYRAHTPGQVGEVLLVDGESSCFYHPTKKAVVPCDGCGRFLCALCDVELERQHLCPKCLEAAKEKKTIDAIEDERYLYDSLAMNLAIAGTILAFCIGPFAFITAAVPLYLAIRHWNAPSSLLPRTRVRSVIAIVLSAIQLVIATIMSLAMFGAIFTS